MVSVQVFHNVLRVFHDVLLVVHNVLCVFHDVSQCFTNVSSCFTMFTELRNDWYRRIGNCAATDRLRDHDNAAGPQGLVISAEIGDNTVKVIPC